MLLGTIEGTAWMRSVSVSDMKLTSMECRRIESDRRLRRISGQLAAWLRRGIAATAARPLFGAMKSDDKPPWHRAFPFPGSVAPAWPISSFARLGGFVIRWPARTWFALFLGS